MSMRRRCSGGGRVKVDEDDDVAKKVGSDDVKASMFRSDDNGMLTVEMLAMDRLADCCIFAAQLRWRVAATGLKKLRKAAFGDQSR